MKAQWQVRLLSLRTKKKVIQKKYKSKRQINHFPFKGLLSGVIQVFYLAYYFMKMYNSLLKIPYSHVLNF